MLRAKAEASGFGFATILGQVLDPRALQPFPRFLSSVSAFDQHLNEQATAPLWMAAIMEQAGVDLIGR